MRVIDAHQHFWHPARGDYGWMPKDNAILNRVYTPQDLAPHLTAAGIDGTVLVQAAPSVEETEYMLGLADATPSVLGVVGWIDFEDQGQRATLIRLAKHPKFLGVRPMIQDIADVAWMLRMDVQWAYHALVELDLTFDALGFPQHLENFAELATRHPSLRVVYDHCVKPAIRDQRAGRDGFGAWADGIARLAENPLACCKLSGLVTEAKDDWTADDLRPFARHVLDVFGPERVMWGSDWPVCRLQAEYPVWHQVAQDLSAHISPADRAQVFGGTAARFYGLG
ncbi:MAG: amidohydrolase family protein [Pseudomonadota bacterium]